MKRLAPALACFIAVSCASGDASTEHVKIKQPDVQVVQLSGPGDQNFPVGLFQVQLGLRIKNNSGEPLTLKQLDMDSMGGGGPYRLRREIYYFDATIAPQQTHEMTFWANAYSTGDRRSIDAYAPVSIRGVAMFESPVGAVRKMFVKVIPQDGSRRE